MKYNILFFLLVLFSPFLFAQKTSEKLNHKLDKWYNGNIQLKNGQNINRTFAYNPMTTEGLLKVKEGNKVSTLTVHHVKKFSFYDSLEFRTRDFYPMAVKPGRELFIELIHESNKFLLLCRETVSISHFSYGYYRHALPTTKNQLLKYLYYKEKDEFVNMSKEGLFYCMENRKKLMKKYIKSKNLNLKNNDDIILVLNYYDKLEIIDLQDNN